MDENKLKQRVDDIIACSGDDETAHSMEDDLHVEIINKFCPEWVIKEIKRLGDADFARWCG